MSKPTGEKQTAVLLSFFRSRAQIIQKGLRVGGGRKVRAFNIILKKEGRKEEMEERKEERKKDKREAKRMEERRRK